MWIPVLQKQFDLGFPKIIVTLGNNADDILNHMRKMGLRAPKSINIYHYTYIMNWPESGGKRRDAGDLERIREYKECIADIAKRYA